MNSPLLGHDQAIISSLIDRIDKGLEEIKNRSISTLHTKLTARIVSPQQLCSFDKLPGVLLNWINSHQNKSQQLLKVLHLLAELSEVEKGCLLLKQYGALEFMEWFRKYMRTQQNNAEDYVIKIDKIIKNILPLGKAEGQDEEVPQPENDPGRINSSSQMEQSTEKDASLPLQSKIPTKFSESLQFLIPRTEMDQILEKQIFDLTVQLKYGNKKIQFETLRMIKEFIEANQCDYFRNKPDLIVELGKYIEDGVYPNQAVSVLATMLDGLIRQQKRLSSWEFKPMKGEEVKPIKFLFPLKQSIVNSPYTQPIMELVSKNFKKEWLDWLTNIKAEWAADYILEMLKQVPKQYLLQRREGIVGLTHIILNSDRFDSELFGEGLLEANQVKQYQQLNEMKEAYRKIRQYQGVAFNPAKHLHQFNRLVENLAEGIQGLGYSPRLVGVYLDTLIYVSIASMREEPLKEYFQPLVGMILQISCHITRAVRIKLYELLLQRCYLQTSISYLSQEFTVSELSLSVLCNPRIFLSLVSNSLSQPQSTVFMLQTLKLLYIHRRQDVHQGFVRIAPVVYILSQSHDKKIAQMGRQIMEKLENQELDCVDVMGMFSMEKKVRVEALQRLLQEQAVEDFVEDFIGQAKRNIKLKPITVDEDSIINYINICGNTSLEPSVRVSAVNELIQLLDRCECTPVVVNRLQSLNSTLLKEISKMNIDNLLLPYILNLNISLALKPYRCRLFDNMQLLVNWLKKPLSFALKHKIISLLYLMSFRNPFSWNDSQIRLHWVLCSEKFYPFVEIPQKIQRIDIDIVPSSETKKQQPQPQIKDAQDLQPFIKFIYCNICQPRQQSNLLELKFQQISPLIGKCLASNSANSSLSLPRTLFEVFSSHQEYFRPLSQEFMAHCVPSLANILNKQNNSLYFDMDAVMIMKAIGVGGDITSGIQQHLNQKYVTVIAEHPSQAIKLKLFLFAKQPSPQLIQAVLKQLPTANQGIARRTYGGLIRKIEQCMGEVINKDIVRLSLTNSLVKSIQSGNPRLQIGALQLMLEITSQKILTQHPTIYNLILELVTKGQCRMFVMATALQVLRKMIKFDAENNLSRIQHLGVVNQLLGWIDDTVLPNMMWAAAVGVLIQIIRTPLIKKYQVVDQVVRLIGRIARQTPKQITEYCIVLYEATSAICLLGETQPRLAQMLLSSTLLLSDLLTTLKQLKFLASQHQNHKLIRKTISSVGQTLFYLSLQQDLFIFHLNKILNDNSENPAANLFGYFAQLMPLSDVIYHKLVSRLITIWYKGHPSLDRDNLGARILDFFGQNIELAYSLLAVSNSAKERFVMSGNFDRLVNKAMLAVDGVFVEDVKKKAQRKKPEESISASRISRTSAAAPVNLSQILLLLKSFFHKAADNSIQVSLPNQNVLALIQKLFSSTANPKRSSQFSELKKAISNLCSNPTFAKDVFGYLLNPKHSFVLELINTCLRSDTYSPVFKQSIDILKIFSSHAEVRTMVYRNRLIAELNTKMIRAYDSKGNGPLDHTKSKFIDEIIKYELFVSAYKDSHTKIITDKHIFDHLLEMVQQIDLKELNCDVLKLLTNLSYSKHNKAIFVGNKQLHKTIMSIATGTTATSEHRRWILHLLYNMLYKSAAAIRIYKKKQVLQQLKYVAEHEATNSEKETLGKILQIIESEYN